MKTRQIDSDTMFKKIVTNSKKNLNEKTYQSRDQAANG